MNVETIERAAEAVVTEARRRVGGGVRDPRFDVPLDVLRDLDDALIAANDARQGIDRACPACKQGLGWDGTARHVRGCPDAPEQEGGEET